MKKRIFSMLLASCFLLIACSGCGDTSESSTVSTEAATTAETVETAETVQVVQDGMQPIFGSDIKDGTYEITVDSSSTMFRITACQLTVKDGTMTADMTMGGTGYLYLYMGSSEDAEKADESDYIPFTENADGTHTFTVPVEALDSGIACSAFSKKKEIWYDRTLVFRADSLPMDARSDDAYTTVESLQLEDGTYTCSVQLEGGSGRASVTSPTTITVKDGTATAEIVWSSSNYDYMKVDDEQYNPTQTEGNATFEIPVLGFDYAMPVSADTTAMSTPHEIDYTLFFDSTTLEKQE